MKKLLLILPLFLLGCGNVVLSSEVTSGTLISVDYADTFFDGGLRYSLATKGGIPIERGINRNYSDKRHRDELLPYLNKEVKISVYCIRLKKCTMKIEELK